MSILFSGIATGGVYALVALGIVLVYRSTGIINFAQSGIVMLGGYAYWLSEAHGLGTTEQLLVVVGVGIGLGAVLWVLMHYVMARATELSRVMATVAIWALMEAIIGLEYGTTPFSVQGWLLGSRTVGVAGIRVPDSFFLIDAVAIALTVLIYAVLQVSNLGRAMRAVAEDPDASTFTGIPVRAVLFASWVASSVVATVAGLLVVPVTGIFPGMGDGIFFAASFAAIIGGLTSIPGALLGGAVVGVLEVYVNYFFGGALEQVIVFAALLLMLSLRPRGILGARIARTA